MKEKWRWLAQYLMVLAPATLLVTAVWYLGLTRAGLGEPEAIGLARLVLQLILLPAAVVSAVNAARAIETSRHRPRLELGFHDGSVERDPTVEAAVSTTFAVDALPTKVILVLMNRGTALSSAYRVRIWMPRVESSPPTESIWSLAFGSEATPSEGWKFAGSTVETVRGHAMHASFTSSGGSPVFPGEELVLCSFQVNQLLEDGEAAQIPIWYVVHDDHKQIASGDLTVALRKQLADSME